MDRDRFEAMSIEELWALHTEIDKALAARIVAEKKELERRLEQARPSYGDSAFNR
ncbi:hypothetical protein JQ596_30260 [Bradyrhizobium manausense]|uniref:hypothetical protein n=1 Tax=Bradyrhizobium TaxID=374 RepID=UPI001BA951D7|nr:MULTISPECIES: hypothetical protein [Bradyrhizobium]MBR0829823.1 hypothetical protein [Bradyrhizobium manausense]UVO25431.1 hypothetical protein KUF59_22795 [Bradyrhizobium arachidis]